jgi:DNA-binding LacI/PurR family transcriptional regulator
VSGYGSVGRRPEEAADVATTIHDVARLAGVSIKTVSNVINDYPHIRPTTRQRVLDAIDELGYRPNLTARGLRSGRTGLITLIIPDLRNAYFAELADSVMRAAGKRGLSVVIAPSGGDREQELSLLRGPRTHMSDGILFSVLGLAEADAHLLADVSIPTVLLGERIFHGPRDHVTMRNTEGAQAATAHLLSLGRRRIVAFGSDPDQQTGSARLRLTGYRRALTEAGVDFDPSLVVDVIGWLRSTGAAAMRTFLQSGVDFDGLVGFNDLIALGAVRVLQEEGIDVPRDVSVIGFDDIDETRYTLPTLSTINPGREQIAEVAVQYLVERIAAGPSDAVPPRHFFADFELVQRESTTLRSHLPSHA